MKIRLGHLDLKTEKVPVEKKVNWGSSSKEARYHYVTFLSEKLDSIDTPDCVAYRDVH